MTKSQQLIKDTFEDRLEELVKIGERMKRLNDLVAATSDPQIRQEVEGLRNDLLTYADELSGSGLKLLKRVA